VLYRLLACRLRRIAQAAVLVRVCLTRLILKGVAVHRVEHETEIVSVLSERNEIVNFVPGKVRRHARRTANQVIDDRTVFELFKYIAWFGQTRESRETGSTGTSAPARHGDYKTLCLGRNGPDVDTAAIQLTGQMLVVPVKLIRQPGILSSD